MAKPANSALLKSAASSEQIALDRLDLDPNNPRFGGHAAKGSSQQDILDHIVSSYGVNDVISSLAVNGYFRAEPLVGRREKNDRVTIVEGNRRLAACLILAGEPRAKNQKRLAEKPRALWELHGSPPIDPVPVILFDDSANKKELLSYLGVRHISASAPWDSYAKAAWVASVVETSSLKVSEVAQMVGDNHQTVSRLLEGYYFMKQAEETGIFDPKQSQKSGRGSVSEYPFSWVYTILGYRTARQYIGLADEGHKKNPVPEKKLEAAGILLRAMFGDRDQGRSSALGDSRELGDLASALASQEKVALLEQGKSISEIARSTLPLNDRLRRNLGDIRSLQAEILSGLSEQDLEEDLAAQHLGAASAARRSAQTIEKRLVIIVSGDVDE